MMVSLSLSVLLLVIPGAFSRCQSSFDGKEFFFGIIQTSRYNYYNYGSQDTPSNDSINLHITNTSPYYTRVHLQVPFTNTDTFYDIPPDQSRTIPVNSNIQKLGTFHERRGIRISSDNYINVLVTCVKSGSNQMAVESYTVLPTISVGKRYFISPGTSRYWGSSSTILITSAFENNQVRLYNTTTGLVTSTFLNKLEVYQYHNAYNQFVGVLIEAERDISVIAGIENENYYFMYSTKYAATTYSVIPTKYWSNRYIVPQMLSTDTVTIKIKSEYVSLRVNVSTSTYSTLSMNRNKTYENTTVVLTAEKPFSVLQDNVFTNESTDSIMMVVPGVDQYINDYRFTIPHLRSNTTHLDLHLTNTVAVIIPKSSKDRLLVDGTPVQYVGNSLEEFPVPAPFNNYTVLSFLINEGHHRIRHINSHVTFGLLVYGSGNHYKVDYGYKDDQRANRQYTFMYTTGSPSTTRSTSRYVPRLTYASTTPTTTTYTPIRYYYSYGFYAGFDLEGGECEQTASEASTHSVPNAYPTSKEAKIPDQSYVTMCYNCEDLGDPNLCDTVKPCLGQEVCFVERQNKSGRMVYRSGCLAADLCTSQHQDSLTKPELCVECCSGSFCNNKGCGGSGLLSREQRGPLCYDCQHVSTPDQCSSITLCSLHQTCRIEQYTWGERFHYKMGCANTLCDPLTRSVHHLLKRSTPVCHTCCNSDFCNNNCTRSNHDNGGSILVG